MLSFYFRYFKQSSHIAMSANARKYMYPVFCRHFYPTLFFTDLLTKVVIFYSQISDGEEAAGPGQRPWP